MSKYKKMLTIIFETWSDGIETLKKYKKIRFSFLKRGSDGSEIWISNFNAVRTTVF